MLLVDLFAYMGDVVSYYQDRIASESFLDTAVERRSILNLLRLIGYELAPPAAASAELTLVFNPPGAGRADDGHDPGRRRVLDHGRRHARADVRLPRRRPADRPGRAGGDRGRRREALLRGPAGPARPAGHRTRSSARRPASRTRRFALAASPVVLDTLVVQVDAGAGPVTWNRRTNLLYHVDADGSIVTSDASATDYYVQFDEDGRAWVVFGDGEYGRRPPVGQRLRARLLRERRRRGRQRPGRRDRRGGRRRSTASRGVTNPLPASGGADAEAVDRAVRFGPLAFSSGDRAVTLADYRSLALQAGLGGEGARPHDRLEPRRPLRRARGRQRSRRRLTS